MFKRKRLHRATTNIFLTGAAVRTPKGMYYIKNGKRWLVPSTRIANSWSFPFVYEIEFDQIKPMPLVGKLGFRDGSLLKNEADGKIYIIDSGRKRLISTPDFWTDYGLQRSDVTRVSAKELSAHENGEPII